MLRFILLVAIFLTYQTESFKAIVIGVTDGDTIVVLTNENKQVKIRLEGIDCPESKQEFGYKAKQATSDLCFEKEVTIEKTGEDLYGRTLAYVYVGELCINKVLLRLGMAWHFKKYNKDPELSMIEVEARQNRIGLWSQSSPMAPWEWRKGITPLKN
jgi:endonuclease YncB( thermonuclease family)